LPRLLFGSKVAWSKARAKPTTTATWFSSTVLR